MCRIPSTLTPFVKGGGKSAPNVDIGLERHENVEKIEIKLTKISLPLPHNPPIPNVFIYYQPLTFKLLVV